MLLCEADDCGIFGEEVGCWAGVEKLVHFPLGVFCGSIDFDWLIAIEQGVAEPIDKLEEELALGYEIRLAVDFQKQRLGPAGRDVRSNNSLTSIPIGPFLKRQQTLLPQPLNRPLMLSFTLLQRSLALPHRSTGLLP